MFEGFKRKSNVWVIVGICLLIIGMGILRSSQQPLFKFLAFLGITGFFMWLCYLLATAKGYSSAWFLLGILGLIGLLILFFFPERKGENFSLR